MLEQGAAGAEAHPELDAVRALMDTSVDPCVDFYRYACGGWVSKFSAGETSFWDRHSELARDAHRVTQEIIADNLGQGSPALDQAREFYASCMAPSAELSRRGPFQSQRGRISRVRTPEQAASAIADIHRRIRVPAMAYEPGRAPFFRLAVAPDLGDPNVDIAYLLPSGLGLDDPARYATGDDREALLSAYQKHIERMFELAGDHPAVAADKSKRASELERKLATFMPTAAAMRDPAQYYRRLSIADVDPLWAQYAGRLGAKATTRISVAPPQYFEALADLLRATPAKTLRAYLDWQWLLAMAQDLPAPLFEEHSRFFNEFVWGTAGIESREHLCVRRTNEWFRSAIGEAFVTRTMNPRAEVMLQGLAEHARNAVRTGVLGADWLDPETKRSALAKLEGLSFKLGAPARYERDAPPEVPKDHLSAILEIAAFQADRSFARIGTARDRDAWIVEPQRVIGHYLPETNTVYVTAGHLRAPFFDLEQPSALNFGAIGEELVHEIIHAIDDQGRQFHADGSWGNWWGAEAEASFAARKHCLVERHNATQWLPGVAVDGELVTGEAIADLGGVKYGLAAYHADAASRSVSELDDRLFLVAFAQNYCATFNEMTARHLAATDPHPPGEHRVNVTLANTPAFWAAYECEEGEPMRAPEACEVW